MINKAILLGYAGKDPERRELDGTIMAVFSLATTERTRGGKEITTWHNITTFGGLASKALSYIQKGTLVKVEGKISNRNYKGSDGALRTYSEILATQIEALKFIKPEDNYLIEDEDLPFPD